MAETIINTEQGTFNKVPSKEAFSCEGCYFDNAGTCMKPLSFDHFCTAPFDSIFLLVKASESSKIYTHDKKYYLTPCDSCIGCCFKIHEMSNSSNCSKPSTYIPCCRTTEHPSSIFKESHASTIEDIELYQEDDEDVKAIKANQALIGDLMLIKQEGLVKVQKEISRCEGCWFYKYSSCARNKWQDDVDMPETCYGIIFVIDVEPEHDDPDWDDDEIEITEEVTDVEFEEAPPMPLKSDGPCDGKTFVSKDGVILTFVKEPYFNSCDGCYFKGFRFCSDQGLMNHPGWILIKLSPIKCGDGILTAIKDSNTRRFSLEYPLTLDEAFPKKELNLIIKKEKKFSI